jgi:trigger factor
VHDAVHGFDHDEERFAQFLESQGKTREQFDTEAREESETSVRTRLVLDALADAEEVSVNDQELTERIVFQAQQYQMAPEEFVQRIQEAGQLGAIYADVRRSKALIQAVRVATVTDASGQPVDLSEVLGEDDGDQAPEVLADESAAEDTAAESDAAEDTAAESDVAEGPAAETPAEEPAAGTAAGGAAGDKAPAGS